MGLFNFGKKKKEENVYVDFPFDAPPNVAVITCRHIMDDNMIRQYKVFGLS